MADKTEKKKTDKKADRKRSDSLMLRALHGRLLSTDLLMRHRGKILCVTLMILVYITNKYNCQTSMEQIQTLERRLEVLRTERIRERSLYMSRTRETGMQALVDSMGLDLHIQERPPYQISYSHETD